MVILILSKRTIFVHYTWLAADNHHEPSILSHIWRELHDNRSHSSITRCKRSWTQQLHQPAMLITVPHFSNIQLNIILPPSAWSHEEWSPFGCYTMLLGMLVLIFGMITVPLAAAWPWIVWEPRISRLGTGIDYSITTDVYLGGLPWCLEVPMWTLSKELHDSCLAQFVLPLPDCMEHSLSWKGTSVCYLVLGDTKLNGFNRMWYTICYN
jgi:hypothetical protein